MILNVEVMRTIVVQKLMRLRELYCMNLCTIYMAYMTSMEMLS